MKFWRRNIRNLKQSMQENVCLRQEIEYLQKKNAELQLEVETVGMKVGFLEGDCNNKTAEEAKKSEIIAEFKLLIEELEREMACVRESEKANRAVAERSTQEFQKLLSEKSFEIKELKKDTDRKKKLEGQLLVFIQENEKLRKVVISVI